ncbi:MAG: Mut7-C RNAse domain-containing protein [Candidatus Micrarchaeota archaeon]|nr:Mut7-C RNAse domain-containing protein [Candidatus Micrarchaeota archaeon]
MPDTKKFLCDIMLYDICRWLRILGIDTEFPKTEEDDEIITIAYKTNRILLTKDKEMYEQAIARDIKAYLILGNDRTTILRNLIKEFDLTIEFPNRTRCTVCNGILRKMTTNEVQKDEIIPEYVKNHHIKNKEIFICKSCSKRYWQGSHWKNINNFIDKLSNDKVDYDGT